MDSVVDETFKSIILPEQIKNIGSKFYLDVFPTGNKDLLIIGNDECPHCINLSNELKKIVDGGLLPSFVYYLPTNANPNTMKTLASMNITAIPNLYRVNRDLSLTAIDFEVLKLDPTYKSIVDILKNKIIV